jgi:uncharacterized membrane protein
MPHDLKLVAGAPLFKYLDEEERRSLATVLVPRRLNKGELLFSQGDPGEVLYLVRRGRLQVYVVNDQGEKIVLDKPGVGEVVGESSLFDGGPRSASIEAIEPSQVLELGRKDLLSFLTRHPHAALDLMRVMGRRLREHQDLMRTQVTRNLNEEIVDRSTFGERVADRVAAFGGSWTFIITFGLFLAAWMLVNIYVYFERPFDPYPFILLNLVLSTIASIQAPVIMMSQNRQSSKDRLRAELDYQVNLKAEQEIEQLHRRLDRIYEVMQAHFAKLEHAEPSTGDEALPPIPEPTRKEAPLPPAVGPTRQEPAAIGEETVIASLLSATEERSRKP